MYVCLWIFEFDFFFFFKQKTAYEMRISDWSSDVCSSDLGAVRQYLAVSDDFGESWRLELTAINAQNKHTNGLAHPFAMVNPQDPNELLVVTVERPLDRKSVV